jgi:fructokinase
MLAPHSDDRPLYGGIEAGGTKFVCAVGSGPDDIRGSIRFPTTTPEDNLGQATAFFSEWHARTPLRAIGIAAFGPLDPDPDSDRFGYITTTPKPNWANTDVVGSFARAFDIPIGFDTDVNGAALGEHVWGAAQGLNTFVYITVGTGIGGGGMLGGKLMHGMVHPEMGHMLVPHDLTRDPYVGKCIYHGDCLEGLAAGPAIERRWGMAAHLLPPDHAAWALEAHYLALGLANIVLALSPQRIIMGGGVMDQAQLFPLIQRRLLEILNGYVQKDALLAHVHEYVVPPGLGNRAGVLGSIALARVAEETAGSKAAP